MINITAILNELVNDEDATYNGDKTGLKKTIMKTLSGLSMTAETYKYNRSNELIKKTNTLTNKSILYTYDKNGNTTSDGTNTYSWDGHNQLVKLTRPDGAAISYTYDGEGKRRTKAATTSSNGDAGRGTRDDRGNSVTSDEGRGTRDDRGNSVTRDAGRGTRDDNRVTGKKVHTSTQTTTYSYDGIKLQYQVNPDSSTTRFNYDADGNLISFTKSARAEELKAEALKASNNVILTLSEAKGKNLKKSESSNSKTNPNSTPTLNPQSPTPNPGQTFYFHTNGHSDIKSITDKDGHEVASYSYDAWGRVLSENGTLAYSQPFRYASYYWDSDSSLYYLIARYYQPKLGRFLSRDPLIGSSTRPLSQNRYVYCENDPVNKSDSSGRWTRYVHYTLTKQWAGNFRFTVGQREVIAWNDYQVDSWATGQINWCYHWERYGARENAWNTYLKSAVRKVGLGYRGKALIDIGIGLHCIQDCWAHDAYWPRQHQTWMDDWNSQTWRQSPTRSETLDYIRTFLARCSW